MLGPHIPPRDPILPTSHEQEGYNFHHLLSIPNFHLLIFNLNLLSFSIPYGMIRTQTYMSKQCTKVPISSTAYKIVSLNLNKLLQSQRCPNNQQGLVQMVEALAT